MERKLASIQKIINIQPIDGYDRVELATVLGWSCIVKKGEFEVGDLAVYFEPDSLLYPHEIWDDFLSKRGYKIKTIKMCKTISQGLILPLTIIENINPEAKYKKIEGFNLTEILNVIHFEKGTILECIEKNNQTHRNIIVKIMFRFELFRFIYLKLFGRNWKGEFPTHIISKTDESNIQSIPNILNINNNKRFYISEKLEGQNGNYLYFPKSGIINKFLNINEFVVCSHNIKLPYKNNSSWWTIAKQYNIEEKLKQYYKDTGKHIGIQGEIIGNNIQGNIYGITGYDFYVFNVKNLDNGHYFTLNEKIEFCKNVGLKLVPILNDDFILTDDLTPQKLLELSNGRSIITPNVLREGFVVRAFDNDRISFKVRSPEYLLKV